MFKRLSAPLALSAVLAATYAALSLLRPAWLTERVNKYLLAILLISLSMVLMRAISFALFDVLFMKRRGREAPALLRGLVSVVGYSILLSPIIKVLGWDLRSFLATSAVATIIIGLALQDTLGNFFAGVSLHIEQPFQIGDAIKVGDVLGRVEAITWRTTAVRTNSNTVIIYPNSRIAREPLEIFHLGALNRRAIRFPAPYSISPEKVISIVKEAIWSVPNLAPEKTPVVRVSDFADSSVTYEVLYWVKDYMLTQDIDSKIKERIWYAFNRSEISIPFPVRHVLLESLQPAALREGADYRSLVESVEIFEPLAPEEIDAIVSSLRKYVYAPGEIIVRRGDAGDSMFIVSRGRVEVQIPSPDGQPQRLATLGRGDFFGEMALFTGEQRAADVRAIEEAEVLEVRKPIIERLLKQNAKLADAFSRKIAQRREGIQTRASGPLEEARPAEQKRILQRIMEFFGLG
jgi:small-conductance mechanosensitive channel/CRP-like cAMP-binding protein